jgi:cytochrome c-type biogenesis protein CcmH/NrfF
MVVLSAEVPQDRMAKQLFYIPAILLLAFVWIVQRRRRRRPADTAQTASA